MSLGRKFLSRKFSKSFRELNRRTEEEEEERERAAAVEASPDDDSGPPHGTTWGTILPELLGEIIQRVEATEDRWQRRRNIVACAGVCKRWRDITKETFSTHLNSGLITFPSCLKQPGPSDSSHQCLIRRNRKNSTFYLYLALSPSLTDKGKFLLAAKRYRHAAHIEYIISLNADDYSQGSNAYVGKLCSDFLGTNFTVYDSEAPHSGARPSNARASRRFASKQISPQVSAGNFEVGNVSYKFNLLKSRGPRRMVCSLRCQNSSSSGESSPSPNNRIDRADDNRKMKKKSESSSSSEYMVLRNKAPRWHEHLQCWCLNFHGRVSVASVKNFQLVAAVDQTQSPGKGDDETVLLQFGKVGDNLFTMDYRQPLSAFMAFAICLTSFGTKIACE